MSAIEHGPEAWQIAQGNIRDVKSVTYGRYNLTSILPVHQPHHMHETPGHFEFPANWEEFNKVLPPEEIIATYPWIDFEIRGSGTYGPISLFLNATRDDEGLHKIHLPKISLNTIDAALLLPRDTQRFDIDLASRRLIHDLRLVRTLA